MKIKSKKSRSNKKDKTLDDDLEFQTGDTEDIPDEPIELPKWYNQFKDDPTDFAETSPDEILSLKIEAQRVLEDETKFYLKKTGKGPQKGGATWLKTIAEKGTAKDQVAALVVSVQNSPVFQLSAINSLVSMVKPAKKSQCLFVMDSLAELFMHDLLRPGYKLKRFNEHPWTQLDELCSGNAHTRRLRLCHWLFEDQLKDSYDKFVTAVKQIAIDNTLDSFREKAISVIFKLLAAHPEQEQVLLSNLVNKLGDPVQKVVSKVIYCLTQLLRIHPNMKMVVLNEVERFLFRPNISSRAQYYSICFLSQFVFSNQDAEVPKHLIQLYFSFFKASIKKGEIDSRLMGALLMGVKRAYPYAHLDSQSLADHINTLYKIVHLANFNISLHTLCLLEQVSKNTEDRFYSALYKKFLDSKLIHTGHQAMFINLVYKALIKDTNIDRLKAMIKRLLQVCLYLPVPFTCGMLFMISQLLSRKKGLYQFSSSENVKEEQPETNQYKGDDDSDDGLETYEDADKLEANNSVNTVNIQESGNSTSHGWMFRPLNTKKKEVTTSSDVYDPRARNPAFAKANKTAYIELLNLQRHFHPTVALFANKILQRETITYQGDPLVDFTLVRFLDRFSFKNPKQLTLAEETKGPDPRIAQRKYYAPSGSKSYGVVSSNYVKQNKNSVPVDELFLYNYVKEKYNFEKKDKPKLDEDGFEEEDDNDSVASDEFDAMLDQIMGDNQINELNFLDDIGDKLKPGKNKESEADEDMEEESEQEMESDDEDEEAEDDDVSELDGSDSQEELEFDSDEDESLGGVDPDDIDNIMAGGKPKSKSSKPKKVKKKAKKRSDGLESLFAPAEEFAEILEEAGSSGFKPGMASTLLNPDNADQKQLNWETKRHRWERDADKKRKFNKKSFKPQKRRKHS